MVRVVKSLQPQQTAEGAARFAVVHSGLGQHAVARWPAQGIAVDASAPTRPRVKSPSRAVSREIYLFRLFQPLKFGHVKWEKKTGR